MSIERVFPSCSSTSARLDISVSRDGRVSLLRSWILSNAKSLLSPRESLLDDDVELEVSLPVLLELESLKTSSASSVSLFSSMLNAYSTEVLFW